MSTRVQPMTTSLEEKRDPVEVSLDSLPMAEAECLARMIHVDICFGASEMSTMSFRFDMLLRREQEMKNTASHFGIASERWDGSRLFKLFAQTGPKNSTDRVVLRPETDKTVKNCSQQLQWAYWMTDLLSGYYRTGQLSVPDDCQGYDLLLALEYFGILYQPDQLQFSSYAAYGRVKHWSDYFTHRCALGDRVADFILRRPKQTVFLFTTALDPSGEDVAVEKEEDPVPALLLGDVGASTCQASAAMVYNFFNLQAGFEQEQPVDDQTLAATMMRKDFAEYLENILTNIRVYFTLRTVTVRHSKRSTSGIQQERAVLRVVVVASAPPITPPYGTKYRTKSQFSAPLDELVEGELKSGALDRLMTEVEQRNHDSPRLTEVEQRHHDSPRQVTGFPEQTKKPNNGVPSPDHVYRDLEETNARPSTPVHSEAVVKAKAMPVFEMESVLSSAPVDVVLSRNDASVTSALTGPGDDTLSYRSTSNDYRAQAVKHEWIQAALLNRGISERIEAFMQSTQPMPNPTSRDVATDRRKAEDPVQSPFEFASIRETWDWFTGLGLCDWPQSKSPMDKAVASELLAIQAKQERRVSLGKSSEKSPRKGPSNKEPPSPSANRAHVIEDDDDGFEIKKAGTKLSVQRVPKLDRCTSIATPSTDDSRLSTEVVVHPSPSRRELRQARTDRKPIQQNAKRRFGLKRLFRRQKTA